jgi:hypothetical protein
VLDGREQELIAIVMIIGTKKQGVLAKMIKVVGS